MSLDVVFAGAGLTSADVTGKAAAMIDVRRASTSIAVALHHGARCVIPVATPEAAGDRRRP